MITLRVVEAISCLAAMIVAQLWIDGVWWHGVLVVMLIAVACTLAYVCGVVQGMKGE